MQNFDRMKCDTARAVPDLVPAAGAGQLPQHVVHVQLTGQARGQFLQDVRRVWGEIHRRPTKCPRFHEGETTTDSIDGMTFPGVKRMPDRASQRVGRKFDGLPIVHAMIVRGL
jgi:hypothetical protein